MASSAVVGVLRALLTADTVQYEGGMRKAAVVTGNFGKEVQKLTPQAERMARAFSGDRILAQANNLVAAVNKVGGANKLTAAEQARVNRTLTEALGKYQALGQQAPAAMRQLAAATSNAEKPTSFLTTKMVALAAAVGTFAANVGMQLVRSVVSMGREAFTTASNFVDLSAKTGESTTSLQRMKFVADQTNASFESLTNGAFMLRQRLAGGSTSVLAALSDLRKESGNAGLSVRSSADEILRALSAVDDEQEQLRLGTLLFGRSFREFSAAVAQGYGDIADAANVATDEQLKALDRAADRWAKFKTNTQTNITAIIGNTLLMADALREVIAEGGVFQSTAAVIEEAQRRINQGLIGGRTTDITLSNQAAKAQQSYAAQLAAVRAELAKLTPAQRAEIAAAQELGEDLSKLEAEMGLTEGALKLLTAQTKDATEAAKKAAEANKAWHASYRDLTSIFAQYIQVGHDANALTRDTMRLFTATPPLITAEAVSIEAELIPSLHGLQAAYEATARAKQQLNELAEAGMLPIEAPSSEGASQEAAAFAQGQIEAIREQWRDFFREVRQNLTRSISDSLGDMLVHLRGFKETFLDIWRSIQRALSNILSAMLEDFVGSFLKGMLRAIGVAKLGQALGNAVAGGAVGASVGSGAAALAGGSFVASEVAGVEAAALGAGGGGAGLGFLSNPAFWTNPITLGVLAGTAIITWGIKEKGWFRGGEEALKVNPRRDKFIAQFGSHHGLAATLTARGAGDGGGALMRALNVADTVREFEAAQSAIIAFLAPFRRGLKSFAMGGFVPPGIVQPALLHGGSHGEMIVPLDRPAAVGPTIININANIRALDGADVTKVWRDQIVPLTKRELLVNQDGLVTAFNRAGFGNRNR